MATTLLDKARTAVLGKMHDLLDNVANTPSAYKQRIRDLEAALADLRAAVDESVGNTNGYRRQLTGLQTSIADKQADIDLLIGDDDPTNDEAALQLQVEVEQLQAQVAQYQELLTASEANSAALNKAVDQLQAKHGEMVMGLNQITLTAAATKAKDRASSATEAAIEASNNAAGASIDSIKARIDHDADTANARFERVVGSLDTGTSPERAAALARAKAQLAARRATITGAATSSATPSPAATSSTS
jgi:phage shock protein A